MEDTSTDILLVDNTSMSTLDEINITNEDKGDDFDDVSHY